MQQVRRAAVAIQYGRDVAEGTTTARGGPDRRAAIDQYRRAAPGYDRYMRRLARIQRAATDRLELPGGGIVLDVACGTGLNFAALRSKVGAVGRVIGIELSPEMAALARARVSSHGWTNVSVIEAAVENARLDVVADGALFSWARAWSVRVRSSRDGGNPSPIWSCAGWHGPT